MFFQHFETKNSQNSLSNPSALFPCFLKPKLHHPGLKNKNFVMSFEFLPDLLQKAKSAQFFGHFETQKAQNSLSNHPDDQQCLGHIIWYQLLTSLDRNAQGKP